MGMARLDVLGVSQRYFFVLHINGSIIRLSPFRFVVEPLIFHFPRPQSGSFAVSFGNDFDKRKCFNRLYYRLKIESSE